MDKKSINQRAIESLKKYFSEDKEDLVNQDLEPLSKEQVTKIVDDEISRYESKINELNELKHKIALEAEESFEKVFGKAKEEPKHERLNTDEMEQKLNEEKEHQMEMMSKLKAEKTSK